MSIYDPPDKPRKTSPYYGANPLLPISRVNPPSKDFYWENSSRQRNDFGPQTNYKWEPTKPTPPNQFFNYTAPTPVPKPTPTNPFFNSTQKWEEPKKFDQFFKYTAPAPVVPTPTNPFFNYTAPAPYNNPFKYYKDAPKVEGDVNFPIVRPQTPFNPDMVPGYTDRRNKIYAKEFVGSLDSWKAENQPRWDLLKVSDPKQYKQIMRNLEIVEEMFSRQQLRPGTNYGLKGGPPNSPILDDRALMINSDGKTLEQIKKKLHPTTMAFVDRDDLTTGWDKLAQYFFNTNFNDRADNARYSTWLTKDIKQFGRPYGELSTKQVGGHEANHIKGYVDPEFRDQQIDNYGSFITSDVRNRKQMKERLKLRGWDYEMSPEEQFSRREEARQYMKDVYGSDDFHKLTAKDAVRIWQESYRNSWGVKGNDTSFPFGDAPLRHINYWPEYDMTDEQIRLLLQDNFGRYPTYNAGGNYGTSGFGR